jgi:branched-chain amino acid transport system permease protein
MTAYLLAIGILTLIYVLLALGLTLQFGLTGLINFGHVGFYAIGAYTSALLTLNGWPIWVGIPAAAIAAMLPAIPIGYVSLRLRDDYFAIVTLGFSEVVRVVVTNARDWTGGTQGLPGIPRLFAAQGATLALIGAIVAEFFGTPIVGMGFRINTEVGRMNIDMVWATIVVAGLAGSLFYALLAAMEKRATFWHASYRERA